MSSTAAEQFILHVFLLQECNEMVSLWPYTIVFSGSFMCCLQFSWFLRFLCLHCASQVSNVSCFSHLCFSCCASHVLVSRFLCFLHLFLVSGFLHLVFLMLHLWSFSCYASCVSPVSPVSCVSHVGHAVSCLRFYLLRLQRVGMAHYSDLIFSN